MFLMKSLRIISTKLTFLFNWNGFAFWLLVEFCFKIKRFCIL